LREAIVTRDVTIRRLNDVLAETIAYENRACPNTHSLEHADEITALRELVADLQSRLSTEVRRRERAEQRHELVRVALSEANAALRTAHDEGQHLREELGAAEAQLSTAPGAGSGDLCNLPATVKGVRLLYVGGRSRQMHHIRTFVEAADAEFLQHDGGVEERRGLLAGMVGCGDAVFFPVDCISHDAAGLLKRLCRQAAKPYVPLRSASLTSFLVALRRFERSRVQESITS
jgi:hypothetical protein